jgi:TolB protein
MTKARWRSAAWISCVTVAAVMLMGADTPYTIAYTTFAPLNTAIFIANSDGTNERVLAPDATFDSNPSFSPDGRWVLFSSRRHGSVDIYRVQVDGTHLERLTDDAAFDDQAVMAPDGRHIAFVSSRSGQADIWLLELQSKRLRNLTNHPGGDYRPAWSPDGKWIAFTSDRDSDGARAHTTFPVFAPLQYTQIYVMRADGSSVRRVTQGDTTVGGASWSPDGKAIAFYEAVPLQWMHHGRQFPSPVVVSQIGRVEVATGVRASLTTGAGRKLTPQWLPDGRIAYLRSDTEEKPGQNHRRPDFWSEKIRFTDGAYGPAGIFTGVRWSPDGKHIVFHRAIEKTPPAVRKAFSPDPQFGLVRTGGFPSFSRDGKQVVHTNSGFTVGDAADYPTPFPVYAMNLDGSNHHVLFQSPTTNASGPVWSPQGDRIAFGLGVSQPSPGRFGPAQIAIVSQDGSGFRRVTPDDEGNYHFPDWSPDGKRLVLRVASPSTKGLSILDIESGRLTPLTPGEGLDNLPKWSPKGDVIAFTGNRDGDWEIYTIRPDGTGLRRLTNSPGNDAHAAWSPDGEWIAFSSARGGFKDEIPRGGGGQTATDIFVMRANGADVRRLTDDAAEEGTVAFAWK